MASSLPDLIKQTDSMRKNELRLQQIFALSSFKGVDKSLLSILDDYLCSGRVLLEAQKISAKEWIKSLNILKAAAERSASIFYTLLVVPELPDPEKENLVAGKIYVSKYSNYYSLLGPDAVLHSGKLPLEIDITSLEPKSGQRAFKTRAFRRAIATITSKAGYAPELNAAQYLSDWIDYLEEEAEQTLASSMSGVQLNGVDPGDASGTAVGGGIDINGDACPDYFIGAPAADPTQGNAPYTGEAYALFGCQPALPNPFELSSLSSENLSGFVIQGIHEGDAAGISVAAVGDMNGDGVDDFAVGASSALDFTGQAYVIYGLKGTAFPNPFNLAELNGENGFTINGQGEYALFGDAIAAAGDINGDGFKDLIIGSGSTSPGGRSGAGEVHIIFGGPNIPAVLNAAELDGSNGFAIEGLAAGDSFGVAVDGGVDINADTFSDVIIGADTAATDDTNIPYGGTAYVIFGAPSFAVKFDLFSLDGSNGFQLKGNTSDGCLGYSVAAIKDMNADGYAEVAVGNPCGYNMPGTAYVVFGNKVFPAVMYLADLNGETGFRMDGIKSGDAFSNVLASVGDVLNQDGLNDLLITAPNASPNDIRNAGQAIVIAGSKTFPPILDLNTLYGQNGYFINGTIAEENMGNAASGVGDITGDGIPDMLMGASRASPHGLYLAGKSYVVEGSAPIVPPTKRPYPIPIPHPLRNSGTLSGDACDSILGMPGKINDASFFALRIGGGNSFSNQNSNIPLKLQ